MADGHWTVEIRIPVVPDENDPLLQVVGRKPTRSPPWHFNVSRQRIRDHGQEYSAFSPTGAPGFHTPMKFAHLYKGLSCKFPFVALNGDLLEDFRAATELVRRRKYPRALEALLAIGERDVTDLQKSAAFKQAAACARALKDDRRAS